MGCCRAAARNARLARTPGRNSASSAGTMRGDTSGRPLWTVTSLFIEDGSPFLARSEGAAILFGKRGFINGRAGQGPDATEGKAGAVFGRQRTRRVVSRAHPMIVRAINEWRMVATLAVIGF